MANRWPGTPDGFQPSSDVHPAGEMLMSYVDGELELDLRSIVDIHLRSCADCRSKVHQFRNGSDVFQKVPALPARRVPLSLRRELYTRIDEHDRRRRILFGFPLPVPSANALALAVSAALLVVIVPQLVGMWGLISGRGGVPDQRASAPETPLAPTTIPLPTMTLPSSQAIAAPTQPPSTPTTEARVQQPVSTPAGSAPATAQQVVVQAPSNQAAAPRQPSVATSLATVSTTPAVQPTATTPPPPVLRAIAGQVTNVNKAQRLITVQTGANADGGARPWSIQLAQTTQVTYRDGSALGIDDVGFADYVEVSGFQTGAAPLQASSVKITQSSVIQAQQKPKVLLLLDGAGSLRAPHYGFTGDWIRRLSETGYDVTAVDPASVSGSTSLKEFALVAIGYPATSTVLPGTFLIGFDGSTFSPSPNA